MYQLNFTTALAAFLSMSFLSVFSFNANSLLGIQAGVVVSASQPQSMQWSPEKGRGSVSGTLSGGRRGAEGTCSPVSGKSSAITLLAPDDTEGLFTTSATPTLHWYVDTQEPVEMTFVLQHPKKAVPVYQQTIQQTRSGIASIVLPTNHPLETGTRYRWSVLLACANGQVDEIAARSFIERVERADLVQRLSGQSVLQQGTTLANAGIWYDAISLLATAYKENPQNSEIKTGLKTLLQQAENKQSEQRLMQLSNKL